MSWIMLPGVMVGGSLLLRRLTIRDADPFQATWIRAFHAHGGVLIMVSILYYMFMDRMALSASAMIVLVYGLITAPRSTSNDLLRTR